MVWKMYLLSNMDILNIYLKISGGESLNKTILDSEELKRELELKTSLNDSIRVGKMEDLQNE